MTNINARVGKSTKESVRVAAHGAVDLPKDPGKPLCSARFPSPEKAFSADKSCWVSGAVVRFLSLKSARSRGKRDEDVALLRAGRMSEARKSLVCGGDTCAADQAEARGWALVDLSSRSRAVVVENSGHHIQLDAPAAVVDAVREILDALRKEPERER